MIIKTLEDAPTKYQTIYADPPWMERGGGKIKRGADRHYPLMKTRDIRNLPVDHIAAPNAHLYLWVTNNFLIQGISVLEAWGFDYKTMITWVKLGRFGLGQYYRGRTEHCLFGTRGSLPYRQTPGGKRIQGQTVIHADRQQHSRKPDQMRDWIEVVSHAPRIELFAREQFAGWDSWGNQL